VKKENLEKDFSVRDATKWLIYDGKDRREVTGKDGLQDMAVKPGVKVTVYTETDGRVIRVRIGTPPKKDE
jgi:hypothetical protein